jgi:uncharacterized protein YjbJ (UPF0337 family)
MPYKTPLAIIWRGENAMEDSKGKFVTQEETGEIPPMDEVEERVEAEMKRLEGAARESVAQGTQNAELEREGRQLREEGERELEEQRGEEKQ